MADTEKMQPEPDDAWLLDPRAPDDAGAKTQAAFRFQHECTARMCIPMIIRETVSAVVCEEHEDCVVFYENAAPELVSVKHREGTRGPWSLHTLCTDGGLRHLFGRWLATGKRATCRLMTNGALKTGGGEAQALADVCHSRTAAGVEPFVSKLVVELDDADADDVRGFLTVLSLECDLPGKEYLASVNVTRLVVPALEQLGLQASLAEGCYERIVDAVARANRSEAWERDETLHIIADPRRLDIESTQTRRLRRRRLDRDRIAALVFPTDPPSAQLTLPDESGSEPAPSRLRQKLERGDLGPTMVEAAIALRASWYAFESRRRTDLPGGDPVFDDLRLRVRELAGLSESRVATADGAYGAEMHLDVRTTVNPEALGAPAAHLHLDEQLLQGLVFQLTDECKIWWSPKFDVEPT